MRRRVGIGLSFIAGFGAGLGLGVTFAIRVYLDFREEEHVSGYIAIRDATLLRPTIGGLQEWVCAACGSRAASVEREDPEEVCWAEGGRIQRRLAQPADIYVTCENKHRVLHTGRLVLQTAAT